MLFGIFIDYDKLLDEIKKFYKNSDVIFVEFGDIYRLDMYRLNLNDNIYDIMKKNIVKNINKYFE